jgi:hypothetical protein
VCGHLPAMEERKKETRPPQNCGFDRLGEASQGPRRSEPCDFLSPSRSVSCGHMLPDLTF